MTSAGAGPEPRCILIAP